MSAIYPQNGPITPHIKQSFGGSNDPFNHYSTTYNIKYGRHWINRNLYREPKPGGNFMWSKRSTIGYSNRLDDYDNPFLKPIMQKNYLSITHRDYSCLTFPRNTESFYNNHKPIVPTEYCLEPKFGPTKQSHNPNDWQTTYSNQFNNKPPKFYDYHNGKNIGKNEPSGFTLNAPIVETLNGRPHETYCCDWPNIYNDRPTEETWYSHVYKPYCLPDGTEPLPTITPNSNTSSGYVEGNKERPDFIPPSQERMKKKIFSPAEIKKLKKIDPQEYIYATQPDSHPSTTHAIYTDPGAQEPSKEEMLNKVKVGDKADTGFTSNQESFNDVIDDPDQFITHYWTKYYDPNVVGAEAAGHVGFQVLPLESDGFVKNNGVHRMAEDLGPKAICSGYRDAYQARSFHARDYVDKI